MFARLIAHQIQKKQHVKAATSHLRDRLLPATELAGDFVQELRGAISQRNPVAGRFVRPAGGKPPFEQRLIKYMAAVDDAQFIGLSRDATELLRSHMAAESFATGGYVVFAEYKHEEDTFFLVALLSTKAQPNFDENLNLISSVAIDFNHLRYAGRVRYSGVPGNEDGVVHFISRRTEELSDYFREFLGCEPVLDSSVQAKLLYTALSNFAETEEMSREDKEEMMHQTHSYWEDCRRNDRPMTVTGLANYLRPDDPRVMSKHLSQESWGLAGEFSPPPSRAMKQFKKFTFSRAGLKLEFDRNDWLGNITVREKSVTIRNAPEDLIKQLAEEKNVD